MRLRSLGLLVGPLVTIAIILVNVAVFLEFLKHPGFVFGLFNTWSNFPRGLVTAIFTPDSPVFACYYTPTSSASYCGAYFLAWFILNVELLVAYIALFFLVNLGERVEELSLRSVYFGVIIILISIVANWISLYKFPGGSVGPSTAGYSGLGLAYGFGIINAFKFFRSRPTPPIPLRTLVAVAFAIPIAILTTALAISNPAAFFNVNVAQRIDSQAHELCFVGGAIASIPVAFRQRITCGLSQMDKKASRKQVLLATAACVLILSLLAIYLSLVGILPDPVATFIFVVLGDTLVAIITYALLGEEKPQLEITTIRDLDKLGFKIITRRKALHYPRVLLNGETYELEEVGVPHQSEIQLMYVDTEYVFFPFRLECSFGTGMWVYAKLYDKDDNLVLNAEMEIDAEKSKKVHTNAVAVLQTLKFNSEELEEERSMELGFQVRPEFKQRREGISPNDAVNVYLVETKRLPGWKKSHRIQIGS